jgi:hypothetical protein
VRRERTLPSIRLERLPPVPEERILAFRLARQRLAPRAVSGSLVRTARDIVGAQAQVPSAGALSLATRMENLLPAELDAALLSRRTMARMWCLRGTTHIVAREDHSLLVASLGADTGGLRAVLRRRGFTDADYERLAGAVLDALGEGPRDRAAIREHVRADHPGAEQWFGSWGGVLRILTQEGRIVFGPSRGGEVTFVRADRWWAARPPPAAPADPLAELLRRYLGAYGPATLADFGHWSGVRGALPRAARDRIASELVETEVSGRPHLLLRRDAGALAGAEPRHSLRLLPVFDCWLLAHRDKTLYLPETQMKAVFRAAGWVSAVILFDGRVVGTWTSRESSAGLEIALAPFAPLPRRTRTLVDTEAERLAAWRTIRLSRVAPP